MNVASAAEYLKIPLPIAIGLARAGYFGFSSKSGHYKRKAIIAFQKYGVQWNSKLGRRVMPEGIDPVVPGWENPPLHTQTAYCISRDKDMDSVKDTCWLANFFFTVNEFYFPEHDAYRPISPLSVKLDKKFTVTNSEERVVVYPNPNGRLALIQVFGTCESEWDFENYLIKAKNLIVPVLNWITINTEVSLPIVQENLTVLPSGNIYFLTSKKPACVTICPQDFTEHFPLRDAHSLYRIGLNCNDDMYSFLSFWRAHEAISSVQNKFIKEYRIQFASVEQVSALIAELSQLRIPEHNAYGSYSGMKMNKVADLLRKKFRNAIAHSHAYGNETILTGSDEASQQKMRAALATLRYLVRAKIDKLEQIFQAVTDIS